MGQDKGSQKLFVLLSSSDCATQGAGRRGTAPTMRAGWRHTRCGFPPGSGAPDPTRNPTRQLLVGAVPSMALP